ncbi:hypothetical protein N2152v2_002947 [Parachlorella kessleri]
MSQWPPPQNVYRTRSFGKNGFDTNGAKPSDFLATGVAQVQAHAGVTLLAKHHQQYYLRRSNSGVFGWAPAFTLKRLVLALLFIECFRLTAIKSLLLPQSSPPHSFSAALQALNTDLVPNTQRHSLGARLKQRAVAIVGQIVFPAGRGRGLREQQHLLLKRLPPQHGEHAAVGAVLAVPGAASGAQSAAEHGGEQQQQGQDAYVDDSVDDATLKDTAYLEDLLPAAAKQAQREQEAQQAWHEDPVDYEAPSVADYDVEGDEDSLRDDDYSDGQATGSKSAAKYPGHPAGGSRLKSDKPEVATSQATGLGKASNGGSSIGSARRQQASSSAEAVPTTAAAGALFLPVPSSKRRWLSFSVCNGLTNQRIAILSAVLLAAESRRTLLLPRLLVNGTQSSNEVNEKNAPSCAFEDIMNPQKFKASLAAQNVTVDMPTFSTPAVTARVDLSRGATLKLLRDVDSEEHVWLTCPLLRVPPSLFLKHEPLVWAALEGMQPADDLKAVVATLEQKIKALSPRQAFNVLHLRVERDWLKQCPGLQDRFACLNNTATVGAQLLQLKIDPQLPLLLVLDRENLDTDMYQAAVSSLKAHRFRPYVLRELADKGYSREQAAMLSYHLGLGAHQFVGNAVSTFSALLIMERAHSGKFAAYYNGGMIPLRQFVPLYQLSSAAPQALDGAGLLGGSKDTKMFGNAKDKPLAAV